MLERLEFSPLAHSPDSRILFVNSSTPITFGTFGTYSSSEVLSTPSQFLHLKSCLFLTAFSQGMDTHLLCTHLSHFMHTIVGKFIFILFRHIPQKYSTFLLASSHSTMLLFFIISLISFITTSSSRQARQLLQIETFDLLGLS